MVVCCRRGDSEAGGRRIAAMQLCLVVVVAAKLFGSVASTDVMGGVRVQHQQPTMKTTTRRQSPTDDLIISEMTTNCPFDDTVNLLDCSRHEMPYTDALFLPVTRIVSFERNFPRSNPTATDESDSSSGREPCLQDDEDCDMFSGDVVSIETPQKKGRKNDGVVFVRTSSTTIVATIRQIQTTMPMMTVATATSRAKKRRTTAPTLMTTMTPALKLSSPAPATTTSMAKSQRPPVVSPPMLLTVPSMFQTTAQHPVLQQPTRTSHEPKGDIDSKAFGSHVVDNGPNSGRVHGNGPDMTRIEDIDRLKWNVGLIIAVAICLAILFLVLAFVIYRFRGVAVTGHRALHHHHHRHCQSGVTGSKVVSSETKGADYVYETCNTLPVTPVSTEISRPLVINRSANIATAASSSATATLLPQQNHHHHHQQQPQQQQQVSNGSRKEVKEWYV